MSDGTKIAWADATWNPIRARRRDGQPNKAGGGWICQRVSAGCQNCYAAGINKRLGTGFDYDARGVAASDIYLAERILTEPLHWRKPRRVFVCSMTDLFGEWVPDEMIDRVFAVMALSKSHTFQLLTKRPERMREYLNGLGADTPEFSTRWDVARRWLRSVLSSPQDRKTMGRWEYVGVMMAYQRFPLPNVWLGVSIENQRVADERIPELLGTPAAVRFVSYEPALGPVDFTRVQPGWLPKESHPHDPIMRLDSLQGLVTGIDEYLERDELGHYRQIDWVIVGGESGPGARPFDIEWARSVVRQCQAAGVAVFCKQGGYHNRCPHDRKGGHFECFPDDLKVREFPNAIR